MRKDWLRRLAAVPHARAACIALLATAAVGQAITQAVMLGESGARAAHQAGLLAVIAAEYALPLALLALLATVPLAVCRPTAAAIAVTLGNVVALASYGQVTVAGLLAELVAAGWLGLAGGLDASGLGGVGTRQQRSGLGGLGATAGRYLAIMLALPFLLLALTGSGRVAVLLASAVPVAGGIGVAAWSGRLARTGTEAGEALADTLLAHTARGERARIARELHDVVAHHISMIAVLAETGRLATPDLPEAGARRFLEIGDTARAGLTEMRRLLGVLREDAAAAETSDYTPSGDPATRGSAAAGGTADTRGSAATQGSVATQGSAALGDPVAARGAANGNTANWDSQAAQGAGATRAAASSSASGATPESGDATVRVADTTGAGGAAGTGDATGTGDSAARTGAFPDVTVPDATLPDATVPGATVPGATFPGGAGPRPTGASRHPQPGLAQLAELIDSAREAAGTGTRLIISGRVAPLDPGIELAAYRIVQEALTNTRRHAPGAAVDVELRYGADVLRLRIRDTGPGPVTAPGSAPGPSGSLGPDSTPGANGVAGSNSFRGPHEAAGQQPTGAPFAARKRQAGGGHGLLGMRERAFSVGGSLYTGMAPGGGFLVEAVLPVGQDPRLGAPRPAAGTEGLPTGASR